MPTILSWASSTRRTPDASGRRCARGWRSYALSLHPDKTRLIEFGRHVADRRAKRGLGKPETLKFLGFVFICEHSRKGRFQLKRKTRSDRTVPDANVRVRVIG